MRFRPILLFVLCLVLPGLSRPEVFSVAGLADPLDNSGGTARATAMGSAFVAVAEDSSATLWNPAGLAQLKSMDFGLHHNSWLASINQETLAFGLPMGRLGGLGLEAGYVDYGTLQAYDSIGNAAGSYGVDSLGGGIGWGGELMKGLDLGAALKGTALNVASNSYVAFAGDAGIQWRPMPALSLGADAANLGTAVAGNSLASALRLGASYRLDFSRESSLLTALGAQVEPQGVSRVQVGAEQTLFSLLAIRLGYQASLADNQILGLTGLSAGLGFTLSGFVLDYAYLPFGDLGAAQRISLSYHFFPPGTGQAPQTEARPPLAAPQTSPSDLAEGQALEKAQRFREAALVYNNAIRKDRSNAAAWRAAGGLYYRLGQKAYAVQCYDQVLRLNPGDSALRTWLDKYRR
jgi:hypothetical protein